MKQHTVAFVFLILVIETRCGMIDSIYGKVKNTTSGLTQDVRNVWTYSKGIVGLEGESPNVDNRTEEEKRGLIGGMVHSARVKVHSVRNYFWNTDEHSNDAGVFGNMYNKVKNRLLKVKGSIPGENPINEQTTKPESDNVKVIRDTLNKLFFGNGTRQVHGNAFKEVIENLRKKLHEIRNNMTVSTTSSPVHHGEGLIDVRAAGTNIQESFNDNLVGIDNDIYDKVDDSLKEVSDISAKSYKNVKDNVDKGVNAIRNGGNSKLNELKEKVSDAAARENQLMETNYKKISDNAKNIGGEVTNMVDDAKRLTN